MIEPARLARSAIVALALLFVAPLGGVGGLPFGGGAAQAATVANIAIAGNAQVDDATIAKYLALRVGDNATSEKLGASIDALQGTGLFRSVSVAMQGRTLSVRVAENPVVASVLFEGNARFSDDNLVAMVDVINRGTVDESGIARDVQSIGKAYRDVGFVDASVATRLEPVGDGRTRVVFVIDEGKRLGIAAINFTGNEHIGSASLKSAIRTKETGWLSWLFRDDNYTQEQLEVDRELVRQYYANHGFPDAHVSEATAEFDRAGKGYHINFAVAEGGRYNYGEVAVESSIAGLDADQLSGVIRTRRGDRFSSRELARSAQDVAVEATNLGYPFADVRPRINRDPASGTFAVTYLVDEGQHLYVERVNISGNVKTRDFVVRRELPFAEGDPFNRALVSQGKDNIESLGFFSRVNIGVEQGSAPDKVVLNVAVVEEGTGEYGATLGYDSREGILGELSLTERNFLGRGQYLRGSVGATQTGKTFDFSFTEPYFMGLKMSAGLDLYHRIGDETDQGVYGITSSGGQLRFGLPVTRDLTATINTGLDRTQVRDDKAPFSAVFTPGNREFHKAWLGYNLTYDGLDDTRHPTEGLYLQFAQTYVGWDYSFLKTEAKGRYFVPLNSDYRLVGSLKLQGGVINNFAPTPVSSLEAFTYGSTLVRGFVNRRIGPKLGGEILGYTAYAGASAELTFPIPGIPENYGLSLALFADAAYIDGVGLGGPADLASVSQPFKSSAGVSLIWESPFGPLRGDMAWILSQSPSDTTTKICADAACPALSLTLQTLL